RLPGASGPSSPGRLDQARRGPHRPVPRRHRGSAPRARRQLPVPLGDRFPHVHAQRGGRRRPGRLLGLLCHPPPFHGASHGRGPRAPLHRPAEGQGRPLRPRPQRRRARRWQQAYPRRRHAGVHLPRHSADDQAQDGRVFAPAEGAAGGLPTARWLRAGL
ncbi:hypothetical protein BN1723_019299, partial [Verticillium longisporum]